MVVPRVYLVVVLGWFPRRGLFLMPRPGTAVRVVVVRVWLVLVWVGRRLLDRLVVLRLRVWLVLVLWGLRWVVRVVVVWGRRLVRRRRCRVVVSWVLGLRRRVVWGLVAELLVRRVVLSRRRLVRRVLRALWVWMVVLVVRWRLLLLRSVFRRVCGPSLMRGSWLVSVSVG